MAGGFAFAAGWIGPHRQSGADIANALEYNGGKHEGYRRAHAKGLCLTGYFEASGAAASLSKAQVFATGRYPVSGRFSVAGGNPLASDGRNVFHSMALVIRTPDGLEWRTAMDHTPVFPVSTPADFASFQIATRPDPTTGKPDPQKVAAFVATHPETRAFQAYMKTAPLPDSFANGTYYSINAFRLIDKAGNSRTVRWRFVPDAAFSALNKQKLDALPKNYLFDEMQTRVKRAPATWRLVLTLASREDNTRDANALWPDTRRQITAGKLTVTSVSPEADAPCRDVNFAPTILPAGMAISDDPLLAARAATYASSFTRRALEGSKPVGSRK
ncbi:MAG TPA: catalase family peroxidase [Asticcacaulis sp.]|nr:catalase family peroxidase [Asticcacaulis sp.]